MMMTKLKLPSFSPRPMPDTKDYMTVAEAAHTLNFHPVSVRRLIKSGKLKSIKVGYATMILRASVAMYKTETDSMSKNDPRRTK